jgi:hypothetical protein
MSAKLRINKPVLLELAKDRGIFYSPKDSREDLVSHISLLPHDYHDLNIVLDKRENSGRAEKVTSITLNADLSIEELKDVVKEYIAETPADEKATSYSKGDSQYNLNVEYSDIDYGKTRLVQRKVKEAGIEFHREDGKTVVRMPANSRAKEIVEKIKNKLEGKRKAIISVDEIDISEFSSAHLRTRFFTDLVSKLKDFKLDNVTSVKVEQLSKSHSDDEVDFDDDQSSEEAKEQALALVRNVALKGESLLSSEEYQSLHKKGFFITSIIWRSKQLSFPYPIIEFEAAFDEPELGKGFKYNIRGVFNYIESDKDYTKTLRHISTEEKQKLLSLIEQTATSVISKIKLEGNSSEEVS